MKFIKKIFYSKFSDEDVILLLEGILNNDYDSSDWDYFISVKFENSSLEKVREKIQDLWAENSRYMKPGSIDPADLNDAGRNEVSQIVEYLQSRKKEG